MARDINKFLATKEDELKWAIDNELPTLAKILRSNIEWAKEEIRNTKTQVIPETPNKQLRLF